VHANARRYFFCFRGIGGEEVSESFRYNSREAPSKTNFYRMLRMKWLVFRPQIQRSIRMSVSRIVCLCMCFSYMFSICRAVNQIVHPYNRPLFGSRDWLLELGVTRRQKAICLWLGFVSQLHPNSNGFRFECFSCPYRLQSSVTFRINWSTY
jgi:hypothetical protein